MFAASSPSTHTHILSQGRTTPKASFPLTFYQHVSFPKVAPTYTLFTLDHAPERAHFPASIRHLARASPPSTLIVFFFMHHTRAVISRRGCDRRMPSSLPWTSRGKFVTGESNGRRLDAQP